jgi:anti-sigma factor ChrR (cupin superfamily)
VQRTHTSLWRMAAGASLPEHDHSAEEECLVISGAVDWSGERYGEGDYLLVQSGFRHTEIHSRDGATLLIRGELTARLEQVFSAHA